MMVFVNVARLLSLKLDVVFFITLINGVIITISKQCIVGDYAQLLH